MVPSGVVVLFTEGKKYQNPDPIAAAALAANLGVRLYTVGGGSPESIDLTVKGFVVHTQLDENMLRAVSDTTGGQYYNASNEEELFKIYDDLKPKLSVRTEEMEITSILAGIGLLTFLVGGVISFLWFGRLP